MSSDPCHFQPQVISWVPQVIGASLAIVGGFFAVAFRQRIETKQEITHIKTSLIDELTEICSIIDKLTETYTTTNIISNIYLTDLAKNTDSFDDLKQRLYLIRDADLRRDISTFYRKLVKNISESINKVNKLGENQPAAHNQIVNDVKQSRTDAMAIKVRLTKYKYRVYLLF